MAYLLLKKGGQKKKKNKKGKQEHPHPYLCMFLHVRKLHAYSVITTGHCTITLFF